MLVKLPVLLVVAHTVGALFLCCAYAVSCSVVPPGYFISATTATLAPCGPGYYRERWAMISGARAQTCTPCGQGIQSEARDMDEHPLAANGSYARATSASCCECCLVKAWL